MSYLIKYNEGKNEYLKITRGVSIDLVISMFSRGKIIADLKHRNPNRYPNQRILVLKIKGQAWAVPYLLNKKDREIFLKTMYPSRVLTRKFLY